MLGNGALAFREFAVRESLPLATIHDAVLEFLRHREDVALFGAQAVNAYVSTARMTEDVDVVSTHAASLADELRAYLNQRFHIATRVRDVREGLGYRVYQVRKPENRHLVDVRPVSVLPPTERIADVLVVTPPELIANKVIAYQARQGKPKAGTDWRDLAMLLLTFPELKTSAGPVRERLEALQAAPSAIAAWEMLVAQEITPEDEDDEF